MSCLKYPKALSYTLGLALLALDGALPGKSSVAQVASTAAPRQSADFERDVLPIFAVHCLDCHDSATGESQLQLDSMLATLRGGNSGEPTVVPGESERSHLMERVLHGDPNKRMPPDAEALSAEEIEVLRNWIDHAPAWDEAREALANQTTNHWSFQPLTRPTVPDSKLAHPIDAFVQSKLDESKLEMSEEAPARRLIRRLFLVMHGLPPTTEQVAEFLDDHRPDAWEQLVDRVLNSPRYGERWASHWLDIVRFGETDGFETNRERPNAFHYRDWVIAAFNDDTPYDEFIKQQLAGDALGEPVGTGFLVAGPNDIVKGQDALLGLMQRQDELTDMVHTTGTAFLGLTTGCARCHNHKFDPISQADFYAMQAVFAGVEHGERELPLSPAAADARIPVNARENAEILQPTDARFVRFTILATNASEPCIDELQIFSGDENVGLASAGAIAKSSGDFVHPLHKLEHVNDGQWGNARSWIASATSGSWIEIELPETVAIDRIVWGRDREGMFTDRVATEYRIATSLDGRQWTEVSSSEDRPLDTAQVYAGMFRKPDATFRLQRGDPTTPREQIAPGAIEVLGQLDLAPDASEQQRRLALAEWIARPEHPLTARVMVNRLWQFHFGSALVDTPSDFGANGATPTHPQLLDWLATEFISGDWSIKRMQRLILTSSTWKQDSTPRHEALRVDAGSRLLWRFPPRRLAAEGIRDCILTASGTIELELGGPGFSAFEVTLENVRHYFPKQEFGPADWRRMIYMTKVRQEKDAVFGLFDCPDGSQVTPQRGRSTTPLQALNLLNSNFVLQQAELLAERLSRDADSTEQRIGRAYELCFGRPAEEIEMAEAAAFIDAHGWTQFARAMLNANEFIFVP